MTPFEDLVLRAAAPTPDRLALRGGVRTTLAPQLHHAAVFASHALARGYAARPQLREKLREGLEGAYAEFIENLGAWERRPADLALPAGNPLLFAGWHFPEVPQLLSVARARSAVLVVSQDAPWLEPLRQAGLTINFRADGGLRRLAEAMRAGRDMAAMLDHSYPDLDGVSVQLFGRERAVPSGILRLAAQHGYRLVFVAARQGRPTVIDTADAKGRSPADLAAWFAGHLEAEVRRAPERWLLWPSQGYRRTPRPVPPAPHRVTP